MADLSDPEIIKGSFISCIWTLSIRYTASLTIIQKAYLDVRAVKTETDWLLLDYISDRSDKLQVTQTGTGGLPELREVLDDTKASYAYARVTYSNDKESTREKFILVVTIPVSSSDILVLTRQRIPQVWIGKKCKVMRKAKISVQSADVKKVLNVFSTEVAAEEKDDLKEDPIIVKLRKVCAISPPGEHT
ncbi:hypothetical protein C0991_010500 [Blastosporella zonata]|nr:hypothetical protein C0991_010500 [Blastosporella zonata]